jgi:hypothetical protein
MSKTQKDMLISNILIANNKTLKELIELNIIYELDYIAQEFDAIFKSQKFC